MKAPSTTSQTTARGFNLFEAMVVTAVMAVLVAIYLPKLDVRSRGRCQRINCANNLKQIGLSLQQWSLDNGGKFPMQIPLTEGGAMEWIAGSNAAHNFSVMSNEFIGSGES